MKENKRKRMASRKVDKICKFKSDRKCSKIITLFVPILKIFKALIFLIWEQTRVMFYTFKPTYFKSLFY